MTNDLVIAPDHVNINGFSYPLEEFKKLEPDLPYPPEGAYYIFQEGLRNCYSDGKSCAQCDPAVETLIKDAIARHIVRQEEAAVAAEKAVVAKKKAAADLAVKALDEDFAERRRRLYPRMGDQLGQLVKSLQYMKSKGVDIGESGLALIDSIEAVKAAVPPLLPKPDFQWIMDTRLVMIYQYNAGVYVIIPRVTASQEEIVALSIETITNKAVDKLVKSALKRPYLLSNTLPA